MSERKFYFPALDGLRLLASLNIVIMHLDASYCLGNYHELPYIGNVILGPMFNASMFFVLGGFIYYFQLAPKAQVFRAWSFLRGRFRKLYPLHALTVALMVFVLVYREQYYGDVNLLWKSVLMHLSMLWAFDPNDFLALNQPSWALTPFFIAYATIGLWLRALVREKRRWVLVAGLVLTLLPSVVVTLLYTHLISAPNVYEKFHMFPLVRVFEFYFGMVLGRLFQVHHGASTPVARPWRRDVLLLLTFFAVWASLPLHWNHGIFLSWFGHHTLAVALYGLIVWQLAYGDGYFARLFSTRLMAMVGRSSFYPYLLHLPLIALTIIIAKALGFASFFREPWQPWAWLVVLYGLSVLHVRRKKRAS